MGPCFYACPKNSLSRKILLNHAIPLGLPRWLSGKESACNLGVTRDVGLILGLGRSPRKGNGKPLQYSCLENPMDRGAEWAIVHGVTQSQTCLKRPSLHSYTTPLSKTMHCFLDHL